MTDFTVHIRHWCSLKDGFQSGNCLPLTSDKNHRIDERTVLIGKKLRNIDHQTISMLCCFEIMHKTATYDPHAAMVSATSMGAFDSVCKLLAESYHSNLPHQISPGNIHNTVINATAGMSAIHYEFDGPNISLCASELSFYEALNKAFILGKTHQVKDIFLSAVESWKGLYGRSLGHVRKNLSANEIYPFECYSSLFMLSIEPKKGDIVLAVRTGRLQAKEGILEKLSSFIKNASIIPEDINKINIWSASVKISVDFVTAVPNTSVTIMPPSARILMSGLGSWQLEHLLATTAKNKVGIQLAIDAEGFYGIAAIKKLNKY